jgi:hypothetical protein
MTTTSQALIRELADTFRRRHDRLDVLVICAGEDIEIGMGVPPGIAAPRPSSLWRPRGFGRCTCSSRSGSGPVERTSSASLQTPTRRGSLSKLATWLWGSGFKASGSSSATGIPSSPVLSTQALVQRFEREERPDLIVLRTSGRRTPSRTNKAKHAGGTATEWNARRQSPETTLWLSEDRAAERARRTLRQSAGRTRVERRQSAGG